MASPQVIVAGGLILLFANLNRDTMAKEPPIAEDRAIAHFVRLGGRFDIGPKNKVVSLYISDAKLNGVDLAHLQALPDLVAPNLSDCKATDAIWPNIAGMRSLEELTLWGTQITDEGLKNIANFPNLRRLDVRGTSIGDAGLSHIATLQKLECLELLGTEVTSAGIAKIAGLSKLKGLSVSSLRKSMTLDWRRLGNSSNSKSLNWRESRSPMQV